MTTHLESIYHCLTCGTVSHVVARECCGHPMVLAAQTSVKDAQDSYKWEAGCPEPPVLTPTPLQASRLKSVSPG